MHSRSSRGDSREVSGAAYPGGSDAKHSRVVRVRLRRAATTGCRCVTVITFTTGDVLEADSDALVNPVNCVGVIGRGLALQFKKAWPENFVASAAACRRGDLQPGRLFVFELGLLTPPRYIVNFPTKRHWRDPCRMGDIESGLSALVVEIRARGIPPIAIPALGAGLGGLAWADVKPRIENVLENLWQVSVTVFEPLQSPA